MLTACTSPVGLTTETDSPSLPAGFRAAESPNLLAEYKEARKNYSGPQTRSSNEIFSAIVALYERELTAFVVKQNQVYYRKYDRAAAEDIVQNVFKNLHRNIAQYDGVRDPKKYIFAIASNAIIDAGRKGKRIFISLNQKDQDGNGRDHSTLLESKIPRPEQVLFREERSQVLGRFRDSVMNYTAETVSAIEKKESEGTLTFDDKKVLPFILKGMTYREIAERFRLPRGTVNSKAHAERTVLRDRYRKLAEYLADD